MKPRFNLAINMITRNDIAPLGMGIAATLMGIGLSRFAYTPLIPELIDKGWFSDSQAVYLGAANLLGYLIGALLANPLARRFSVAFLLNISFAAVALSFLLCSWPAPFSWFFCWRLLAGIAGAVLVVSGPALALQSTPEQRRSTVGILSFSGIGLGTLISALCVPLLLNISLTASWLGLGILASIVALLGIYSLRQITLAPPPEHVEKSVFKTPGWILALVIIAYALDAMGFVPHTVFWVDYLVREQAMASQSASIQWALFGLGALFGPWLASLAAKRWGIGKSLLSAFGIKTLAIALPVFASSPWAYSLSSVLVGAMIPAIVSLTSGRIAELTGPDAHRHYWGLATAAFAIAQAASGYGLSALYVSIKTYQPLFLLGAGLLLSGFILQLLIQQPIKQSRSTP